MTEKSSIDSRPERATTRRLGGRTAENTGRLFDATLSILSAEGLHGVTFAAVAARAEVNRSTLYRRWPNPAALVLEALASRIDAQILLADKGSFRADLQAALSGLGSFLRSPEGLAGLAAAASLVGDPQSKTIVQALWQERFSALNAIFVRAEARGEIPVGFDAEALIAGLSGAMYFRILVAAGELNDAWIKRVLNAFLPLAKPHRQ